MIIQIDVSDILSLPITSTTAGVTAGSSVSVNVVNTNGFSADDFAVVGSLGDEASEIQVAHTITDADTFVFSSLSLSHPSGTPIQRVLYDQISLERSSDNSSWSVIATISIKGDQRRIDYNDTAGTTSSYYRFRYYNSTTATYSAYSNSFSVASLPSAIDTIVDEVIKELGTEYDEVVNKDVIFTALADTDIKIARELARSNKEFNKSSDEINLIAGTTDYALLPTVVTITDVQVGYASSANRVRSEEVPLEYGLVDEDFGRVLHSSYRSSSDGLIHLVLRTEPPSNVTDGIKYYFITRPTRIQKTTDTLLTPQPLLYSDVIKNGIKQIIFRDYKNDLKKSQFFEQLFLDGLYDIRALTNTYDYTPGVKIISDELGYVFTP